MSLVCYITDRCTSPRPILEQIKTAIEAGVDFIQIREKDLATRELLEIASVTRSMAIGCTTRILINDRLDIALAASLDGVHLGNHSVAPGIIRKRVSKKDFLIGVSVHSLDEVREIQDQGVDFLALGPVFYTPSKAAYGSPLGLECLEAACQVSKVPIFALGGVTRENFRACLRAGAVGVAGIRLFQDLPEAVGEVVREIRSFHLKNRGVPHIPSHRHQG